MRFSSAWLVVLAAQVFQGAARPIAQTHDYDIWDGWNESGPPEAIPPLWAPSGPRWQDVWQGRTLNCWLYAAMLMYADRRPQDIMDMFKVDAHGYVSPDGTVTVVLPPDPRASGGSKRIETTITWDPDPLKTMPRTKNEGDPWWPIALTQALQQVHPDLDIMRKAPVNRGLELLSGEKVEKLDASRIYNPQERESPSTRQIAAFFEKANAGEITVIGTKSDPGLYYLPVIVTEQTLPFLLPQHAYGVRNYSKGRITLLDPFKGAVGTYDFRTIMPLLKTVSQMGTTALRRRDNSTELD